MHQDGIEVARRKEQYKGAGSATGFAVKSSTSVIPTQGPQNPASLQEAATPVWYPVRSATEPGSSAHENDQQTKAVFTLDNFR